MKLLFYKSIIFIYVISFSFLLKADLGCKDLYFKMKELYNQRINEIAQLRRQDRDKIEEYKESIEEDERKRLKQAIEENDQALTKVEANIEINNDQVNSNAQVRQELAPLMLSLWRETRRLEKQIPWYSKFLYLTLSKQQKLNKRKLKSNKIELTKLKDQSKESRENRLELSDIQAGLNKEFNNIRERLESDQLVLDNFQEHLNNLTTEYIESQQKKANELEAELDQELKGIAREWLNDNLQVFIQVRKNIQLIMETFRCGTECANFALNKIEDINSALSSINSAISFETMETIEVMNRSINANNSSVSTVYSLTSNYWTEEAGSDFEKAKDAINEVNKKVQSFSQKLSQLQENQILIADTNVDGIDLGQSFSADYLNLTDTLIDLSGNSSEVLNLYLGISILTDLSSAERSLKSTKTSLVALAKSFQKKLKALMDLKTALSDEQQRILNQEANRIFSKFLEKEMSNS